MRQQVDLFAIGFVEPRVVLPLRQAALILAIVAVCMGLLHALVGYQYLQSNRLAGQLAGQVSAQEDQLAQLQALSTPGENAQLRAGLERARAQLAGRQRLLQTIRQQKKSPGTAFSAYLRGLAGQPQDGLWLTHIRLEEGGRVIGLQGRTVAPENVPRLLLDLQSVEAFHGARFDDLSMYLIEGRSLEPLQFELRSRPGGDA